MKESLDQNIRRLANGAVMLILFFVPFHAFLTVFGNKLVGYYTLLRLWPEFLLALVTLAALWVWTTQPAIRRRLLADKLWWCLGAFGLLYGLGAAAGVGLHAVAPKAAAYGLLTGTRFLLFFAAVWLLAEPTSQLWRWRYKLLLGPAAVVVVFGLLQRFLLPYDVLKHVGYGPATIRPYQLVDKKRAYVRIISTLRGANPLGAYLVVVLGVLTGRYFAVRRKWWVLGLAVGVVVVLTATYSRSAWIGAFVGVGLVTASKLKHLFTVRRAVAISLFSCLVFGVLLFTFRHNDFVQNTFFHTDEHSAAATSSNHDHESASLHALRDVVRQPLGGGTGSAGPASVYNTGQARIAEDYYLQVGQEIGGLGLILFLAICALVARRLYDRRQDPLALGLLAAFIGLVAVNLLSHAWADDTLSYLWWGFAGLVVGALEPTPSAAEKSQGSTLKT